jgi:hypothetical protein
MAGILWGRADFDRVILGDVGPGGVDPEQGPDCDLRNRRCTDRFGLRFCAPSTTGAIIPLRSGPLCMARVGSIWWNTRLGIRPGGWFGPFTPRANLSPSFTIMRGRKTGGDNRLAGNTYQQD